MILENKPNIMFKNTWTIYLALGIIVLFSILLWFIIPNTESKPKSKKQTLVERTIAYRAQSVADSTITMIGTTITYAKESPYKIGDRVLIYPEFDGLPMIICADTGAITKYPIYIILERIERYE